MIRKYLIKSGYTIERQELVSLVIVDRQCSQKRKSLDGLVVKDALQLDRQTLPGYMDYVALLVDNKLPGEFWCFGLIEVHDKTIILS